MPLFIFSLLISLMLLSMLIFANIALRPVYAIADMLILPLGVSYCHLFACRLI